MEVIEEYKVGYKETKFGWIPDDWSPTTINQISGNRKSNFNDGDWIESVHIVDEGIRIVQTGNIGIGRFIDKKKKKYISEDSFNELKCTEIFEGDILICRLADPSGRACLLPALEDYKAVTSVDISILRPNSSIGISNYLVQFFSASNWLNQVKRRSAGSTRSRISRSELGKIKFYLPPIPEQQEIASILSDWDRAIEKTQALIDKLQFRKKGLIQQFLTGKTRLAGFNRKWRKVSISKIATQFTDKNKNDDVIEVLSCTKYDGLVRSLEYFGRKVYGNDLSKYKIVPKGYFAYATNHIEEGSIGYQDLMDRGLVSPMYTVFKTDESINDSFMYRLLKTDRMIYNYQRNMSGSIARRGGLRWNVFETIDVTIPELEEQNAIAEFFDNIDQEIHQSEIYLERLKAQKKGLMQKLLTGEIRVKT